MSKLFIIANKKNTGKRTLREGIEWLNREMRTCVEITDDGRMTHFHSKSPKVSSSL